MMKSDWLSTFYSWMRLETKTTVEETTSHTSDVTSTNSTVPSIAVYGSATPSSLATCLTTTNSTVATTVVSSTTPTTNSSAPPVVVLPSLRPTTTSPVIETSTTTSVLETIPSLTTSEPETPEQT